MKTDERVVVMEHPGSIKSLAVSSDEQYIISGSSDGTICVWSTETGNLVMPPLTYHVDSVMSIVLSSDGSRIYSGSMDKSIRVCDLQAGLSALAITATSSNTDDVSPSIVLTPQTPGQDGNQLDLSVVSSFPDDEGWICGPNRELTLWVPHECRAGFWTPHTLKIIGMPTVRVELDGCAHGPEWTKCYTPRS